MCQSCSVCWLNGTGVFQTPLDDINGVMADPSRSIPAPTLDRVPKEVIPTAVGDVLICSSPEHARVVSDMARVLELPYLPFRLWVVEGTNSYGEGRMGTPSIHFSRLPVWFSVGDYDNIVGFRRLMHMYPIRDSAPLNQGPFEECQRFPDSQQIKLQTAGAVLSPKDVWSTQDTPGADSELIYDAGWNLDSGSERYVFPVALRLAYTSDVTTRILTSVFSGDSKTTLSGDVVVLPGGADCKQPAANGAPFHYDSTGKACFSAEEAAKTAELLRDHDVIHRALAAVSNSRMVLPQQAYDKEHFFCNESVYTNCSILCVSGVIRMAH